MRTPSRAIARSLLAGATAFGLVVGCNEVSGVNHFDVVEPFDGGGYLDAPTSSSDSGAVVVDAGKDAHDSATPPPPKLVFVTSSPFKGNLGGRDGADGLCKEAAANAGLTPTSWIAWLSITGHPAIERITHAGAYRLVNGVEVVATPAQLTTGTIEHAINVTEDDIELTTNRGVWTGTNPDGSVDATCSDWTDNSKGSTGTLASALATDEGWTKGAPDPLAPNNWFCDNAVSLYCFEQ